MARQILAVLSRQIAPVFNLMLLGGLPLGAMAQDWMAPPVLPPAGDRPQIKAPTPAFSGQGAAPSLPSCPNPSTTELKVIPTSPYASLLKRSWVAYGDRFIHADGYVVDYQAADQRTTSEGQAYAMLRAVMINDQATFDKTLAWAEMNLNRSSDSLWSWHWNAKSGIQDPNFATDADIDAVTALIFAARRWNCPAYEVLAQKKLNDIWQQTVTTVQGRQFILPGPRAAFQDRPETILNPSYFSPYAYRLFAQVDKEHNWLGLVDDGYALLNAMTAVSSAGLPADWVAFNPSTNQFGPVPEGRSIKTVYSFDAFRVWWRVGLDANWYDSAPAKAYLKQHLPTLAQHWKRDKAIPAVLGLDGKAQVDYDSTAQYAMLYPVMKQVDRTVAFEIFKEKLLGNYSRGIWDGEDAYYTNNLAWFALLPPQGPRQLLLP